MITRFALLISTLTLFCCLTLTWGIDILNLEDNFTFEKVHTRPKVANQRDKHIYKNNQDGETWMLSPTFTERDFRYFSTNAFFCYFNKDLFPEVALIFDKKGNPHLGVKFIKNFKTLNDFFNKDFNLIKNCFPQGCTLSDPDKIGLPTEITSLDIQYSEFIMALLLLAGDVDGSHENIGLIPSSEKEGVYLTAKIDHESSQQLILPNAPPIPLRALAKAAFGEGVMFHAMPFDYYNIDMEKLAQAFESIAKIDTSAMTAYLEREVDQVFKHIKGKVSHDPWLSDFEDYRKLTLSKLSVLEERIKASASFAKGIRIESAIRKKDIEALKALFATKEYSPDKTYEHLFLTMADTTSKLTLNELWVKNSKGIATQEDKELLSYGIWEERPLTPLEMAIAYQASKEFSSKELVNELFNLSSSETRENSRELRQYVDNFIKQSQSLDQVADIIL